MTDTTKVPGGEQRLVALLRAKAAEWEEPQYVRVARAFHTAADIAGPYESRLLAAEKRLAEQDAHIARQNAHVAEVEAENDRLEAENKALRRTRWGEVWYWQADSEDHLESLNCPVLIEAETLRKMQRDHRETVRAFIFSEDQKREEIRGLLKERETQRIADRLVALLADAPEEKP